MSDRSEGVDAAGSSPVGDEARSLLQDSLVWDDVLPWTRRSNLGLTDTLLPRFKEAGVDFVSLTPVGGPGSTLDETINVLARLRREIAERSDWLVLATSVAHIRDARTAGKLAVNFNLQETLPFGDSLGTVQLYYDLGVRQTLLAYNRRNLVADGCAERTDAGLSRFGVEVVKEMNRVGMLVDGTHTGHRSTLDAMEVCEGPFVFSHSNPYAVHAHYRNIKDDQIKACAATGGVIGINGVGAFLGDPAAGTDAIFACLDYVVELVGPQHVGLGLDYVCDPGPLIASANADTLGWPEGVGMGEFVFAGPEQVGELLQHMLDHGYPHDAITGILGENWARVCESVWK